jgi:hypothetical protein
LTDTLTPAPAAATATETINPPLAVETTGVPVYCTPLIVNV